MVHVLNRVHNQVSGQRQWMQCGNLKCFSVKSLRVHCHTEFCSRIVWFRCEMKIVGDAEGKMNWFEPGTHLVVFLTFTLPWFKLDENPVSTHLSRWFEDPFHERYYSSLLFYYHLNTGFWVSIRCILIECSHKICEQRAQTSLCSIFSTENPLWTMGLIKNEDYNIWSKLQSQQQQQRKLSRSARPGWNS